MKRFHVHVAVEDLERSIAFYAGLFGAPPTVRKSDYAKWMVEDPRLNFAISQRGGTPGVNHLGLQADSAEELETIRSAFTAADAASVVAQPDAMCCYVRSDKHWLTDPQGIAWEGYHSLAAVEFFDGVATPDGPAVSGCCGPADPGVAQTAGAATAGITPAANASRSAAPAEAVAAASCCASVGTVAAPQPRPAGGGCCAR